METKFKRGGGILLHITSLPSKYGIGDLGEEAYKFVFFLQNCKQKYWQILPLGADGDRNSPYKCSSSFAGNYLLISPEKLVECSLLTNADISDGSFRQGNINYKSVKEYKEGLLRKAYQNFKQSKSERLHNDMEVFIKENTYWLEDYVLFKTAARKYKDSDWSKWEAGIKDRDQVSLNKLKRELADEIDKYNFIQYIFYKQWSELKEYANQNGIKIIGDISMYVDYESADTWSNQELYDLDSAGNYKSIAGFPPDFFSKEGQVWGNPLYNWEEHKKSNFEWWLHRISHSLKMVDYVRIDHFRGFDSFFAIPNDTKKACDGVFKSGPSYELLDILQKNIRDMPIIVEDLGNIDKSVEQLRDAYNLPGMRILEMAFESKDAAGYNPNFLPHNYIPNTIAYTGTHDNMTVKQWFEDFNTDDRAKSNFKQYINKASTSNDQIDICWEMIRLLYASVASVSIIPLQDILELGEEGRMNRPGILEGNWEWRFKQGDLTSEITERLRQLVEIYGR